LGGSRVLTRRRHRAATVQFHFLEQAKMFVEADAKARRSGVSFCLVREKIHSAKRLQSSVGEQKQIYYRWNLYRLTLFAYRPILDARQLVDTMKKILLATVAILAFTAPSFAQDKTVGQAPPSGASSFYLAQDTASMKCQVVNTQPAAGGSMKVIGTAHPTQASAQTALTADKTCIK
jgi:hypothetical protein